MGKEKKEKKSANESQNEGEIDEMSYEDRLKFVSIISKPMAPKKLTKKVSTVFETFFYGQLGRFCKSALK